VFDSAIFVDDSDIGCSDGTLTITPTWSTVNSLTGSAAYTLSHDAEDDGSNNVLFQLLPPASTSVFIGSYNTGVSCYNGTNRLTAPITFSSTGGAPFISPVTMALIDFKENIVLSLSATTVTRTTATFLLNDLPSTLTLMILNGWTLFATLTNGDGNRAASASGGFFAQPITFVPSMTGGSILPSHGALTTSITYSGNLPSSSAGVTAYASFGGQQVQAKISNYAVENGQGTFLLAVPETLAVPNTGAGVSFVVLQSSSAVLTAVYQVHCWGLGCIGQ